MLIQQNKMPVQESAMPVKLRLRLRKPMQCLQCNACAKPVDQRNPWIPSRTYGFHGIHAIPGIQCLYSRTRCLSNRIQCLWTPHGACAMQCNACRAIPMHQNMIPVILLLANRPTSTRHRSRGGKPAKTQSLPRHSSDDPKSFHGAPQMNQRPHIIWWDTERS